MKQRMIEQFLPRLREYTATFGLTAERGGLFGPSTIVMHPEPIRRGSEVSAGMADGPVSVTTTQVANGVAVRMAVLYLLRGLEAPVGA